MKSSFLSCRSGFFAERIKGQVFDLMFSGRVYLTCASLKLAHVSMLLAEETTMRTTACQSEQIGFHLSADFFHSFLNSLLSFFLC